MRSRFVATLASVVVLGSVAGRAAAGVRDDPAPAMEDGPGKVVYRLGAIAYDPSHVDFSVTCTNVGARALHVVLEVYDDDDRRAGAPSAMRLAARAMGTFASSASAVAGGDVVVARVPAIDHGRARVSANRGSVVCTAVSWVRGDDGETREVPVALLKRVAPVDE